MGSLGLIVGYFIVISSDLLALALFLDFIFHLLPNSKLNYLRRIIFLSIRPLLSAGFDILQIKWKSFDSRGLILLILLLFMAHLGFSWILLICYTLRG